MSPPTVVEVRPPGPYDLRASAFGRSGGTRRWSGGLLDLAFRVDGEPCWARVRQRPDGVIEAAVHSDPDRCDRAVERLRFLLAADVDVRPFLERFADDALVGEAVRRRRGMRPLPRASVAHALVRAMCGQLVRWQEAARTEARILRMAAPTLGELRLPPTRGEIAGLAPASVAAAGLATRRATALVRVANTLDLESLRAHPTDAVVRRICREPQLGPWSAGVIVTDGLGRLDAGPVGDLGLIRLAEIVLGRPATVADTADMLAPYGEWAGLAGAYLLAHPALSAKGPAGTMSGAAYAR